MERRQRILNIIVTCILFGSFISLAIFVYKDSYFRIGEAFVDVWNSIRYFIQKVFHTDWEVENTVLDYSKVLEWQKILPENCDNFKLKAKIFFTFIFSKNNFSLYIVNFRNNLKNFLKIIVIFIPVCIILWLVIKAIYSKCNTKHNKDTIPLKIYKKVIGVSIIPIRNFISQYISFFRSYMHLVTIMVILWLLNFNLLTIVVEFFAYYFYFVLTYDLSTLYIQFGKLFIDLQAIFLHIPLWLIILIVIVFLYRFRIKLAKAKLRHMEARNCGFINELSIVSMACGSMGKKKTTLITDMALSQEVMFRQKALELLQKNDMKFPYFSWISFEDEIKLCIEYRQIYNLATVKEWIKKKRERFELSGNAETQLYGYNVSRYGLNYDDGLKIWNIFDVLFSYAQLYFVYIIQSSLILSNYSIRVDNIFADSGNFPLWITDFFPEVTRDGGRHAHIIDYDALRLGKKLLSNNPKTGSFEFGVLVMSEIGKERGNNLELREVKKSKDETNQKNDLFNSWLKMCRHSSTIDNFPFIKVFTDEQRPESWGADARDCVTRFVTEKVTHRTKWRVNAFWRTNISICGMKG